MSTLQQTYTLGFNIGVTNGLYYTDESHAVFSAGHSLVRMDTDASTRSQRVLHASPSSVAITAMATSSSRRYTAYAEQLPGGANPTISVIDWSGKGGRKRIIRDLPFNSVRIHALAFTEDGRHLIVQAGAPSWQVHVISWEKPRILASFPEKPGASTAKPVRQIACRQGSPTDLDSVLVVQVGESLLRVLRLKDGKALLPQTPQVRHEARDCCSVAFVGGGERFAVGTRGGDILLMDGPEFRRVVPGSPGDGPVDVLAAFSKGFLAGCDGGRLRIFDKAEDPRQAFKLHQEFTVPADPSRFVHLAISASENEAALSMTSGQCYTFKLANYMLHKEDDIVFAPLIAPLHAPSPGGDAAVVAADCATRKPLLVTAGADRTVRVWSHLQYLGSDCGLSTDAHPNVELVKRFSEDISSVAIHPSGLMLLVGFESGLQLQGLLMEDLKPVKDLPIRRCPCVKFSHNGQFFAACNGSNVAVYQTTTCETVCLLRGHSDRVISLSWSPNDNYLVTGGRDGVVARWHVPSGRSTQRAEFAERVVEAVECEHSPDAREVLVTASPFNASGSCSLFKLKLVASAAEQASTEAQAAAAAAAIGVASGSVRGRGGTGSRSGSRGAAAQAGAGITAPRTAAASSGVLAGGRGGRVEVEAEVVLHNARPLGVRALPAAGVVLVATSERVAPSDLDVRAGMSATADAAGAGGGPSGGVQRGALRALQLPLSKGSTALPYQEIVPHAGPLSCFCVSPDQRLVVTGARDGCIALHRPAGLVGRRPDTVPHDVVMVSSLGDRKSIATDRDRSRCPSDASQDGGAAGPAGSSLVDRADGGFGVQGRAAAPAGGGGGGADPSGKSGVAPAIASNPDFSLTVGELPWGEEVLVTRAALQGSREQREKLRQSVAEVKLQNSSRLGGKKSQDDRKMKEVEQDYEGEVGDEQRRLEALRGEKGTMEERFFDQETQMQRQQDQELENLESGYKAKITGEIERYDALVQRRNERDREFERSVEEAKKEHGEHLQQLRERYRRDTEAEEQRTQQLLAERDRLRQDVDGRKTDMEQTSDRRMDHARARYHARLAAQKKVTLHLVAENSVMRAYHQKLKDDKQRRHVEMEELRGAEQGLREEIASLQKDVAGHQKEIRERDDTIVEKEARIHDLRRKNQELEKFRFVLNYKIQELQRQIAPRQQEIREMRVQMKDMELELLQYHKSNAALDLMIGELQLKKRGFDGELSRAQEATRGLRERQGTLQKELHSVVQHIDDFKALAEAFTALYRKHVHGDESARGTHLLAQPDDAKTVRSEYARVRVHLERGVEGLRRKLAKGASTHRAEKQRLMRENTLLTREVNELRRELRVLQLQDAGGVAGVAGAGAAASPGGRGSAGESKSREGDSKSRLLAGIARQDREERERGRIEAIEETSKAAAARSRAARGLSRTMARRGIAAGAAPAGTAKAEGQKPTAASKRTLAALSASVRAGGAVTQPLPAVPGAIGRSSPSPRPPSPLQVPNGGAGAPARPGRVLAEAAGGAEAGEDAGAALLAARVAANAARVAHSPQAVDFLKSMVGQQEAQQILSAAVAEGSVAQ